MIEVSLTAFTEDGDASFEKDFIMPVVPRVGEDIWVHDKYWVSNGADPVLEVVKITEVTYRVAPESDGGFSVLLYGTHTGCV